MESLNVKVDNLGKLKRKITVNVPQSEVREAYDKCFMSLKDKVRINGFRKGKYPRSFLEKRFQKAMENEVIETLAPKYFDMALKQENLELVGRPKFSDLQIDKNKPLVFSAEFEVFDEFEIPEYSSFSLDKIDIEVTEEEFNQQKQAHLDQAVQYIVKDGSAEDQDQVVLDYEGWVDGSSIDKNENYPYIINSKLMMPEFEEALKGVKKGEEKKFTLTFPDNYHQASLQNKTADFLLKVKEVKKRGGLPEINEEFLEKYGEQVKTEEDFEQFVRNEASFKKTHEAKTKYRQKLKEQLSDILTFDVPEKLLNEEVNIKLDKAKQSREYKGATEEELKKEFEKTAIDQFRFTIFIQKMLQKENIKPDESEVQRRFQYHSIIMGTSPDELIKEDFGKQLFQDMYSIVAEETALDFIADKVTEQ